MNRQQQRQSNIEDSSLSNLTAHLYKTLYGQEDEHLVNRLAAHYDQLSWHAQFRVWLRTAAASRNNYTSALPLILSRLQAILLHDSSSLMWDTEDDTTSWKHDVMLQQWNVTRYIVSRDIQKLSLKRQEEMDIRRIIEGIDKLVGYDDQQNPLQVLNEFYHYLTDAPSTQQTVNNNAVGVPAETNEQSNEYTGEDYVEAGRLLQAIEQAPQWRVRGTIRQVSSPQVLWTLCRCSSKSGHPRRGQALLVSYLLLSGLQDMDPSISIAPAPSLSSADDNDIKSTLRDYLYDSDGIPNVHQLTLKLWEYHLNQEDILETIQEFASWLPIQPLALRYRELLSNDSDMDSTRLIRATDLLCALIDNQVEEWKEIWDDEVMTSTLLPLVHEIVLHPCSKMIDSYATVVNVLDRVLKHTSSMQAIPTTCPQLGWIVFLLANVPANDLDLANHVEKAKQLYARFSIHNNGPLLPPMKLYMESIIMACKKSQSKDTGRNEWMRHVIQTLTIYNQNDEVATEWFRFLSTDEAAARPLTKALHRKVCMWLWGSDVKLSKSLPQLLATYQNSRILSWTPPECLFARTRDLSSELEQLLSTFGEMKPLSVIAIGIALAIPMRNTLNAFKCRDILYQRLRPFVANGDFRFVARVQRELTQHSASLEWWAALQKDLLRNEVPIFEAKDESPKFNVSLIDEHLLVRKRKRHRKEDTVGASGGPRNTNMCMTQEEGI